jgi:hypothetical protein
MSASVINSKESAFDIKYSDLLATYLGNDPLAGRNLINASHSFELSQNKPPNHLTKLFSHSA